MPRNTVSRNGKEFNEIFHKCVDDVLKEVLGENTAKAILYHLGVRGSSDKVEAFSEALEELFGSGAQILERKILEVLYRRAGRTFRERRGYKFADYVNEFKASMTLWEKRENGEGRYVPRPD